MAVFTEIARRGLSHPKAVSLFARATAFKRDNNVEIPAWGAVLLFSTLFFSFIFVSLVSYMLNELVVALCMVESPVAAITVSPSAYEEGDKDEKEGLLETGPTITLVHQKAITSSIRGTVKHLVASAGRWARFRGLRIHVLYAFAFSTVANILSGVFPRVPGQILFLAAMTGASCANLHAAWTHKVISMPSDKTFWQRVPSKSHWKKLAVPAAVQAVMPYVAIYLTCGFGMLMGLHKVHREDPTKYNCSQWMSVLVRSIFLVVFAIFSMLFLCIPASVTLVRVEASLLPEDEDTIVPFDRTFGGVVMSKLVGGTGVVSFVEAWRSFNWDARRRVLKLFVKNFFIMIGIGFVIVHVLAFEIFAIMGPQLGKFLSELKHEGFLIK